MVSTLLQGMISVDFPQRLAWLRKQKGINQNELADAIGLHVSQVKRYEKGTSQPTLGVLKKIALTFSVSADLLLFGLDELSPDEEFRVQFDALKQLDEEGKKAARILLDGLILRHQAKQWTKAS